MPTTSVEGMDSGEFLSEVAGASTWEEPMSSALLSGTASQYELDSSNFQYPSSMEGYAERVAAWAMAAGLDSASASKASDRHEGGLKFLLSCLDQDGFVEVEEEGGSIHLDTNTNSA